MRMTALWRSLGGLVILGVAVQLIPYGRDHSDPPVRQEPVWDRATTREMAVRACYDCHSNQTVWPWYSQIAPVSWLIQRDVQVGRQRLNFSEWDRPQRARGLDRRIQRGSMPPWYYVLMHSKANLSPAEKEALLRGLQTTMAQNPPPPPAKREARGREEHEG